jgi:hypothetical protein
VIQQGPNGVKNAEKSRIEGAIIAKIAEKTGFGDGFFVADEGEVGGGLDGWEGGMLELGSLCVTKFFLLKRKFNIRKLPLRICFCRVFSNALTLNST